MLYLYLNHLLLERYLPNFIQISFNYENTGNVKKISILINAL